MIGMDYFFMTDEGLCTRDELSSYPKSPEGEAALQAARVKGDMVKCLIIRCSHTKCVFAHVVPVKGVDEDQHVVQLAVDDIRWMGHTKLILKATMNVPSSDWSEKHSSCSM